MNITVFSKNRGCQLDLFLRSLERFFSDVKKERVTVIFTADADYALGYHRCRSDHSWVTFMNQGDFKMDVLDAINPDDLLTVFFCDDDVFIRKFSLRSVVVQQFEQSDDIATLSLRMDRRYNYCFDADLPSPAPAFHANGTWDWQRQYYDWGYPMCTSAHIFKTADILTILDSTDYRNPNELESRMCEHYINKPKMLCFNKAKTVNTPLNLVQTQYTQNRAGSVSLDLLEERYIFGARLSLKNVLETEFIGCQQIVEPKWA